jgi:hypothetical protein
MSRPHEDREKHTPVDHRPGGEPLFFASGTWCAIDVAHAKTDRSQAAISSYETLIEQARTTSAKARSSAVFSSDNGRRVVAIIELGGHEGFRHLETAWNDHHRYAEHRVKDESSVLELYRVLEGAGGVSIDPDSHTKYAIDRVAHEPARADALTTAISGQAGFLGVIVFGKDDDTRSIILYWFETREALESARTSEAVQRVLGPLGETGESFFLAHLVKTFE